MENPGPRPTHIEGKPKPGHEEPRGPVGAEPRLPAGKDMDGHQYPDLHYRRFAGDLFVGGVSGSDVGQGDLGDCFFLASLAAFAKTNPDGVRRAITDNDDGTYTVTFRVRIEPRFPAHANGAQAFGKGLKSGSHGQELWPALFEKAYATWQGGYVHVNQGGDGGAALTSLTGKASESLTPNRLSTEALWQRLRDAVKAGHPMVTSTPFTRQLEKRTGMRNLDGLIEGHYYAVFDAYERGGQRYVKLYSPLVDFTSAPVSTPTRADNPERTIELALEDYRRDFDQLVVNGASR